ncbi:MAG: sulfotransferase family 2 domain-containing protein [Alphaproteobacteria bacterium]|nr:sulfotransferase family 2 domain-containing protein [Alphaproteobacteria bacterium]
MIVSYEHNYIFIKTRKTAGTSLEIALSTHTGDADVITPVSATDELTRAENPRARLPQNFSADPKLEHAYREAVRSGKENHIKKFQSRDLKGKYIFRNHMPLAEIRSKLNSEFFARAFKFTIERHPFDRMISLAYWKQRNDNSIEISRKIDQLLSERRLNNIEFYTLDGKVAVDYVVRYENLREGLDAIGSRIGGPDLWDALPRTKHTHRADHRPAAEILSSHQKKRIVRQCRQEFELFGYEA